MEGPGALSLKLSTGELLPRCWPFHRAVFAYGRVRHAPGMAARDHSPSPAVPLPGRFGSPRELIRGRGRTAVTSALVSAGEEDGLWLLGT